MEICFLTMTDKIMPGAVDCFVWFQKCYALWVYTPQGHTVNQHISLQVLRYFCGVVCCKWLHMWNLVDGKFNMPIHVPTDASLCSNFYLNIVFHKWESLPVHQIRLPVPFFCFLNWKKKLDLRFSWWWRYWWCSSGFGRLVDSENSLIQYKWLAVGNSKNWACEVLPALAGMMEQVCTCWRNLLWGELTYHPSKYSILVSHIQSWHFLSRLLGSFPGFKTPLEHEADHSYPPSAKV
jgi:hypothetical protein